MCGIVIILTQLSKTFEFFESTDAPLKEHILIRPFCLFPNTTREQVIDVLVEAKLFLFELSLYSLSNVKQNNSVIQCILIH